MEGRVKRLIVSVILVTLIRSAHIQGAAFHCEEGCTCTGVEIDCHDADLDSIPVFETIQGANIVDLSDNHIDEIGDVLPWQGIEQLQFLYLNTNSIFYINENAFVTLVNLEYADLSNNYIEIIPSNLFESNLRLKSLYLHGNSFQSFTPAIVSKSLEILDLSFSKLSTFTNENIRHLPNLKQLDLHVNNIKFLQSTIFDQNPGISLDLSYNSWTCNCSTVELFKWVLDNEPKIVVDGTCYNKNNLPITFFNQTKDFVFKERCDIDEDTFGITTNMKNLSLTKSPFNTTNSSILLNKVSSIENDNDYFDNAWIVFIVMALVIVLVAIAFGVVVGFVVGRFLDQHKNAYRNCIADGPTFV